MASRPVAAPVLIGLGLSELSVVPSVYAEIKQIIRKVEYSRCEELADSLLSMDNEAEISAKVRKFFETLEPAVA